MDIKNIFVSFIAGLVGAAVYQNLVPSRTTPVSRSALESGKIITASQIVLVDEKGRARVQIGVPKDTPPGIWLRDEKGVLREELGLYEDGTAYFGLQDAQGQMIELMRSFGPHEAPLLIFKNQG